VPNINDPEFDEPRETDGFLALRARLGRQAGAERLGLSMWKLEPGQAAYPYHYHHTEEELVLVLTGTPSLRTPTGWRELDEGETVRFLAFSSSGEPDVVVYPDSDKLGVYERLPDGGGLRAMFRVGDAVDYYEGETPPGEA
jgi:hypothetical protein